MKRLLTWLTLSLTALTATATDYTERLLVLVNGEGAEQEATISVTESDGLYTLNLRNFVLMNGDSPVPVGNVEVAGIVPAVYGDVTVLRASRQVEITEGDLADVPFWMGTMLGALPVDIVATIKGDQLYALINLDLTDMLGQIVEVRFNKDFIDRKGLQMPNGGFEEWHTSSGNFVEPNGWHSFESATGQLAPLAGHHIEKSDLGRNGSSCARIYATSIFGIVANGTMTTGRMNAGSMLAADKQNHAYMDINSTDVDGNGDPFFTPLNVRPDSLVLWLQFNQGTPNSEHPYATVSAVITDGSRYQDPEDKTYTNVVAKAANRQISVTGKGVWQRLSIPFEYVSNDLEPKALMVTISTNADAGSGSADDEVLVDDIALVYNARLASLSIDGFSSDRYEYEVEHDADIKDLSYTTDGQGAYVTVSETTDGNSKLTEIAVISADLSTTTVYTIKVKDTESGIVQATTPVLEGEGKYWSLDGRQVRVPGRGLYLIRKANGQNVKSLIGNPQRID